MAKRSSPHLPTVGYIRVSTTSEEQLRSLEGQRFRMKELGVDRIIEDAITGSGSKARPGWTELWELVERRAIGCLVFVDLSRLARDGTDMGLLKACGQAGIVVIDTFGKVWENETVVGFATSGTLSLMNQLQSKLISVKVRDGLARRVRAGYLARGRLPFGYLHVDGKAVEHPQHWSAARQLVELLIRFEMNISGVLRELPEGFPWQPTARGLANWWQNPMLRGGVGRDAPRGTRDYQRIDWGHAPPLVTSREWMLMKRLAQIRQGGRRGSQLRSRTTHLFSGMIRCTGCGKNLHHVLEKRRSTRRWKCKNSACRWFGKGLREDLVRRLVAEALVARAQKMAELRQLQVQPIHPERAKLGHQLEQLQKLEAQGVEGLRGSILRLRDQIAIIDTPIEEVVLDETLELAFSDPRAFLEAPDEALRPVLLHFVAQISYLGTPDGCRVRLSP
jgi:DNA invertase Pin-like site-specific DNA recombinase